MFTPCLEQEGCEISPQELLQLFFVVGNAKDPEVDSFDELELSLLWRWSGHIG